MNYQGKLAQIDPVQGQLTWSSDVSSVAGLEVTPTLVFVTDEFDTVHAYSRETGELQWSQDKLSNRDLTSPVVYESGSVIVGDLDGFLHILSVEDGEIIGRVKTGIGAIAAQPVLQGNMVYVQGRTGKVAAVKL